MNALIESLEAEKLAEEVVIVAFPCNQFGKQEPGKNEELLNGLFHVRPGNGYTPKFTVAEKVDVNGDTSIELFKRLRADCPGTTSTIGNPANMYWSPVEQNDITWNFGKFLVDKEGLVYKRYNPAYPPQNMLRDIRQVLSKEYTAATKATQQAVKYLEQVQHKPLTQ